MKKRSLIVGMGIGQLYKTVLKELGHQVVTVDQDPNKKADFTNVTYAINQYRDFDTVHICTPNFTHFELANKLAPCTKIVFIEKPGVATSNDWRTLNETHPNTRFMMVKNNMWRNNIEDLKVLARTAKIVNLNWINKDRVPSPGSWFTTKELSYGGVSRDLMPHLLSLYIALNPDWKKDKPTLAQASQRWELDDLTSTDYGTVNLNGIYDVDDTCRYDFNYKWRLTADWRDRISDCRNIEFINAEDEFNTVELGLCPEDAYYMMIYNAVKNIDNDQFWKDQFEQDMWIHERLENLCK
jgi:predicted dehydrogenase